MTPLFTPTEQRAFFMLEAKGVFPDRGNGIENVIRIPAVFENGSRDVQKSDVIP
jgi:hypothetical protein